jgi:membrane protease YdiL (CAAX protease family)
VTAHAFWTRTAAGTALAVTLAVVLEPPQPDLRVPRTPALLAGLAAGGALFVVVSRRRPSFRCRRGPKSASVGRHLFLALCAANEEVLWRRVLLGELLFAGTAAAVALSSAGFALAHRRARLIHIGTGSAFAGVYLATGFLGASIAAHWAYNALVGGLVERRPP